jgi:hypothetical protein
MRRIVATIVWLTAAETAAQIAVGAQTPSLPWCRDLTVTISVAAPRVLVGQRPRFDVSIYNMSASPRRVLDLRDGRRPDLQTAYVDLVVSRNGAELSLPRMISDPGPISPTDFVELPVSSGIHIPDLPTDRDLSKLPIGALDAHIVFWRDPYDARSRCRSAPVAFTVVASLPMPPPDDPLADLVGQLSTLADGDLTDCGTYLFPKSGAFFGWTPPREDLAQSLVCGRATIAGGRSFRIIAQGTGIDSWIADGLLGTPRSIVHFRYDSMGRRLRTTPCPKPAVHLSRGVFECGDASPRP